MECCFKACRNPNEDAYIQMEIFHTDEGSRLLYFHEQCFAACCQSGVKHDDPKEHGHIPKNARCVFCGDPLPIFGHYPYCFDIGTFSPPHRYWAHSLCMKALLTTEGEENLPF